MLRRIPMETKFSSENLSLRRNHWLALHEALRGDGQFGQRLGVVVVGGMMASWPCHCASIWPWSTKSTSRFFHVGSGVKPASFSSEPEITCSASANAYS